MLEDKALASGKIGPFADLTFLPGTWNISFGTWNLEQFLFFCIHYDATIHV